MTSKPRHGEPEEIDYGRGEIVSRSSDSRYRDIGQYHQEIVAQTTKAVEAKANSVIAEMAPDAERGRKTIATAAAARKGKDFAKNKRWDEIRKCVKRHLAANKKNTLTYARRQAEDELSYSMSTIIAATKNLKK